MKNNKLLFACIYAAVFICMLSAFYKPSTESVAPELNTNAIALNANSAYFAVGGNQYFNFRKDTITNAAIDTIPIGKRSSTAFNLVARPTNFLSLFTYDISIVRASLSGTHNVKVYLDKSSEYNPSPTSGASITDWVTIDSTSTTTATNAMLRSTDATGFRYRLRIKGTGTQSSAYTIYSAWKQKN